MLFRRIIRNGLVSASATPFIQFLKNFVSQDADAAARKAEAARKRAEDLGNGSVQMNGRELFLHEPWVFDNERF